MRKNQKGFSGLEALLLLVVICLLVCAGWYVYKSQHKTSQSSGAATNGWLTFKSTKSSITFSYPPNWHLKAPSPSHGLEDVELDGPHSFSMQYTLVNRPTGPNIADCIAASQSTQIPINNQYYMLFDMGFNNLANIALRNTNRSDVTEHNCQTFNLVTPNTVFTFSGQYQYGSHYASTKTQTAYLSLPEVRTAKTIFASFHQDLSALSTSAHPAPSQCGCQEGNTCANISACEGQATPSQP